MPGVPASIKIVSSAFAMDGGSVYVQFEDEIGAARSLHIPQHALAGNFRPELPPGALILDDHVLPTRGAEEAALIAALKSATYAPRVPRARGNPVASKGRRVILGDDLKERFAAIDKGPEHAMRHTVRGIIDFVESEEFVAVARTHGRFP